MPLFVAAFLSLTSGSVFAKTIKGTGVDRTGLAITKEKGFTATLKNQLSVEVSNVQAVAVLPNPEEIGTDLLKSRPTYRIAPEQSMEIPLADIDMIKQLIGTSHAIIGCGTSSNAPSTEGSYSSTAAVPLTLVWTFSVPSGRKHNTKEVVFIYLDLLR